MNEYTEFNIHSTIFSKRHNLIFKFNFSDCAELVCVLFIFQEIMRCPVSEGLRELVSWAKIYLVIWNALHS